MLHELGRRIRCRREAMGLTRPALSEACGLSVRFLAQVESGAGNISLKKLFALAEAIGVAPSELIADLDRRDRSIALIGLRGAGKSTVGAGLAKALERRFVEVDEEIEKVAGLSLGEIFTLHGETYYQRLQKDVLESLLNNPTPQVLAIGGSIVEDGSTFELLLSRAVVVWLKAMPTDHWHRVIQQGDLRPMAENPSAFAELEDILKSRTPLYERAHVTIDTSKHLPDSIIAQTISRMQLTL